MAGAFLRLRFLTITLGYCRVKLLRTSNKQRALLVISGPTREKIDDVRYISNYSSGKMGESLCFAAKDLGFDSTVVITGPCPARYESADEIFRVESATQMLECAQSMMQDFDIIVNCAAVCDFRPKNYASGKLKKGRDSHRLESLELVENPDILAILSSRKSIRQVVVGFAAECESLIDNASIKLAKKGCDMIVANDVSASSTFGSDTSQITLITSGFTDRYEEASKKDNAVVILTEALSIYHRREMGVG